MFYYANFNYYNDYKNINVNSNKLFLSHFFSYNFALKYDLCFVRFTHWCMTCLPFDGKFLLVTLYLWIINASMGKAFWVTALVADFSHSLVTGRHGRVQRAERQKEGKNELNPRFPTETDNSERCYLMHFPLSLQSGDYLVKKKRCKHLKAKLSHIKRMVSDYDRRSWRSFPSLERKQLLDGIVTAQMCWHLSRCGFIATRELLDIWLITHVNTQGIRIAQCNIFPESLMNHF